MADTQGNRSSKADERLMLIKHKVLVLSGKGGVGKSTVAAQLAFTLRAAGKTVGILDLDICGPSIPHLLGVDGGQVHGGPEGWQPVFADEEKKLAVMSVGFLLPDKNSAVIWRGPRKNSMVAQFVQEVNWGYLDYLIIDTPPGTSDEHISIVEMLRSQDPDGAIIVTTPQNLSVADVRKEVNFCKKLEVDVLGVIENMSGFVCPGCQTVHNIFAKGGGEGLAKDMNVPFLGTVPIDPILGLAEDHGQNFLEKNRGSPSAGSLLQIAQKITEACNEKEAERVRKFTEMMSLSAKSNDPFDSESSGEES